MDRFYGGFNIVMRESTVETLLLWNTDDEYKHENYDFLFTQMIFIGITENSPEARESKTQFITELFGHRVGNNPDRCSKLHDYIRLAGRQENQGNMTGNVDPLPEQLPMIPVDIFSGDIVFTISVNIHNHQLFKILVGPIEG